MPGSPETGAGVERRRYSCMSIPRVTLTVQESPPAMVPSPNTLADISHLPPIIDGTPTPTRYVSQQYSCGGLFEEVCVGLNPFDEQFRRARPHQHISLETSPPPSLEVSPSSPAAPDCLVTPRIVPPPAPVDSDHTITSTSRDPPPHHGDDCVECGEVTSSQLLRVAPPCRSLSELSARVRVRDVVDVVDGSSHLYGESDRYYDRRADDARPCVEIIGCSSRASCGSVDDVVLDGDVASAATTQRRRVSVTGDEDAITCLTGNSSSSSGSSCSTPRLAGRLVRRSSGRQRLSVNVTTASEAGRAAEGSSIISTPTPVITAGPCLTQSRKSVTPSVSSTSPVFTATPPVLASPPPRTATHPSVAATHATVLTHASLASYTVAAGGCPHVAGAPHTTVAPHHSAAPHPTVAPHVAMMAAAAVPPASASATVLQLFLRLPSGEAIPVAIPATPMVSCSPSTPMVSCSPSTPFASYFPATPFTSCSSTASTASLSTPTTPTVAADTGLPGPSLAKMRLKAALTSAPRSMTRPLASRAHTAHRIAAMTRQTQDVPPEQHSDHCAEGSGDGPRFKRGHEDHCPDDHGEKRQKFLERNRAAAVRCREKKKAWVQRLAYKSTELAGVNTRLQTEVSGLRAEVAALKSLLLRHKTCPVTLADRDAQQQLEDSAQPSPAPSASPAHSTPHSGLPPLRAASACVQVAPRPALGPLKPRCRSLSLPSVQVKSGEAPMLMRQQPAAVQPFAIIPTTQPLNLMTAAAFHVIPNSQQPLNLMSNAQPLNLISSTPPHTMVSSQAMSLCGSPQSTSFTVASSPRSAYRASRDDFTLTSLASSLQCVQSSLTSSTRVLTSLGTTAAHNSQISPDAPRLLLPGMATVPEEDVPSTAAIIEDIADIEETSAGRAPVAGDGSSPGSSVSEDRRLSLCSHERSEEYGISGLRDSPSAAASVTPVITVTAVSEATCGDAGIMSGSIVAYDGRPA